MHGRMSIKYHITYRNYSLAKYQTSSVRLWLEYAYQCFTAASYEKHMMTYSTGEVIYHSMKYTGESQVFKSYGLVCE